MRIRKFYISYGGYFGTNEQFQKKGRDVYYYSQDSPFSDLRDVIPDEALCIRPDKRQWKSFIAAIRPFPTYWKREYFAEVCDGIQWEVKIITDDFVFKSHGSNAFPSDFEDFLKIVREFTGVGEFADGFDRKMSRV